MTDEHYEEDAIISAHTLLKGWNIKGTENGRSLFTKLKTFGTVIFEGIRTSINYRYYSIFLIHNEH